jgi:hypothetical protein
MPDEKEETGFVVRDRRRFMSDAPPAPEAADAPAAPPAPPPPPPAPATPPPTGIDLNAAFAAGAQDEDVDEAYEQGYGGTGGEGGEGEEGSLPDVYSVLALFLGELRNLALIRLGLVPNPVTGQPEGDLAQARVAIDTVAFLASQLDNVVSPEERLPLKALVSDMQMAFVEISKRAGNSGGGGGAQ